MDADFIDKRLLFYGFNDFFKKRMIIKALLPTKSIKEQYLYRWYLYSRPFISDKLKNFMWDYLQNDMSELDFVLVYSTCIKNKN